MEKVIFKRAALSAAVFAALVAPGIRAGAHFAEFLTKE